MPDTIGVGKGNSQIGGYFWRAPIGTTLPTSATDTLANAFVRVSRISRDGVTTTRDSTVLEETDWAGDLVYSDTTDRKISKSMTLLDNTKVANQVAFGDDAVTGTDTAFSVKDGNFEHEEYVYVWDTLINKTLRKRAVFPRGKVTGIDNIQEQPGSTLGMPITISGLYDETTAATCITYYATITEGSNNG